MEIPRRSRVESVLVGLFRIAIALWLSLDAVGCAGVRPDSTSPRFRVGAAVAPITPDTNAGSPVWLAGYGNGRAATGVHDDLFARAIVIEGEDGRRIALVAVDLVGMFLEHTRRARRGIEALGIGLRSSEVVVASTHGHEGPDTMGIWGPTREETGIHLPYLRLVEERIAEAARRAAASMREATLRFVEIRVPDGLNCDGRLPRVVDPRLLLLEATDRRDGRPIATLVNYASHPEILGRDNRQITADYPAFLLRAIERERGGVGIFLAGAIGGLLHPGCVRMTDPATGEPAPRDSFRNAELYGEELARLALEARGRSVPSRRGDVWIETREIEIPLANDRFRAGLASGVIGAGELHERFRAGANGEWTFTTEVGLARIGDGLLLLVPGEIYPELIQGGVPDPAEAGADFPEAPAEPPLLPRMAAPFRLVVGLANDEIGYLIPRRQWDAVPPHAYGRSDPQYGEVNSVGPMGGATVSAALHALLEETRGGEIPPASRQP